MKYLPSLKHYKTLCFCQVNRSSIVVYGAECVVVVLDHPVRHEEYALPREWKNRMMRRNSARDEAAKEATEQGPILTASGVPRT